MTVSEPIRILFVEDDEILREATVQALELAGYHVDAFDNAAAGFRTLDADFAGVIVSDVRLPGMDGLEFFAAIKQLDHELPVIFTTGHGDVAMAVEAMRNGAADYLTKPYSSANLFEAIRKAAQTRLLVIENRKLRGELIKREQPRVLGSSMQAEQLGRMISEAAGADIDLMITGESGTGKNFVAQQIHALGPRNGRHFVTIDAGICAHEDAELLLFGRAPGSGLSRSGIFERANGGTVFLDEIDSLPEPIQARLLSVIDSRMILPLGADRQQPVNIRIIAATRHLAASPPDGIGGITAQLFYRLSGLSIRLPTLNERREDLPEIFRYFVAEYERELGLQASRMTEVEWHHLTSHSWNGNLRELRAFARNFVLGLSQITPISVDRPNNSSLREMTERFERAVLEDALRRTEGRVAEIARILKIQRKTLYDKLTKYDLTPADYRTGRMADD